jgi:anaerobic selenocysteine-containing dehydrogenase
MAEVRYRTCNLCEAMCGLKMTVEGGRITDVRADEEDVFSRGHICAKGPAMREVLEDHDRLRVPVRRTASGWQQIGWDEALAETAQRLDALRSRHGRDSIGVYVGNPVAHNHGAALALLGFLGALGTRNRFDANSQDANPKLYACMLMFGDALSLTLPDVDRTSYLLIIGANPAASNGSVMTLGDVRGRLRGIRERGGRIVLVDPRRTETAAWADEHVFIRPGGDTAFLAALLHSLLTAGLCDEIAIAREARGLAALRDAVLPFSPELVAPAVGIAAETIRRIAGELASAEAAVAYGRVGICQNEFGATASWLCEAVNVVTGNFDRPGGAMFATPAVDLTRFARKLIGNHHGRWRSRVRGLAELGGQLPAAVMAEEMDTPGEGQIRGFVTLAGNPVLSTPNAERLEAALARLEFMVAIDFYINETTRHAHLILPPMHVLERGHYDVVFHALAVRNTVKYSEPVVPPSAEGARDDFAILYELSMRLGGMRFGNAAVDGLARAAWRRGLVPKPDQIIDLFVRAGSYGDRFLPGHRGLNLRKIRAAPHGIDLGPLVPCRGEKVILPGGLVDLAPAPLLADLPRALRWVDQARPPLVLIGRRHVRTNNSWMHNCASLVKGPDRSTLLVHPDDAKRHGLTTGARVRVRSRVGQAIAEVETTEDIMPGVVSLPHGFGHGAARDTLRIAGGVKGPNINLLTDDQRLEPLTGTAALAGVPVEVEAM